MATTLAHASLSVPLPLEQYAQAFDDLFRTSLQRRRFREYLAGLLVPRDRNKTLTALMGAEPITQAQTAPVQQLQFFFTESEWDAEAVTARQIDRLRTEPLTMPHADGALVIDSPRRDRCAQGRHPYGPCRLPVPGHDRHDRQRHRRRHQPVG